MTVGGSPPNDDDDEETAETTVWLGAADSLGDDGVVSDSGTHLMAIPVRPPSKGTARQISF